MAQDVKDRLAEAAAAAEPTTLEKRLAEKAASGDLVRGSGPPLDQMTRQQRHKLLFGE